MTATATLIPESQSAESLFPPIADYGFLSNCEQSCLIAPDGSVEWLCLPRPDSPSVFGALLDRAAGLFRFGPAVASIRRIVRRRLSMLSSHGAKYTARDQIA